MTDLARILAQWRELEAAGADYVLTTIVAVEGPSYRKPGALMLLTSDGRRVGTVSGGCLEAEVASRAWWLTANGPTIQRYSTVDDDGERPFGSGCGGVVYLLLERRVTAAPLLAALERAFDQRVAMSVATVLEGKHIGRRAFATQEAEGSANLVRATKEEPPFDGRLEELAAGALSARESMDTRIDGEEFSARAWADYRPARPALGIFGAGDDAQPLVRQAKELGWFVSITDGRSNLATRNRFPLADRVSVLPIKDLPGLPSDEALIAFSDLHPEDAAVIMTHSFEQDSKVLACLLQLESPPAYIGVLGPLRRTRELLTEAARILNLPPSGVAAQAERWLARLHAPTGLDLGADSAETIALSALAEIQKFRTSSTALPLREVRAVIETVAR